MDDDGDTLLIRGKLVEFISHLCLATGGSSFHKSPLSGDSTRDNVSIFLSTADEKKHRQAAIETTVLHRQAAIETTVLWKHPPPIDSSTLIEWSRLWGAR